MNKLPPLGTSIRAIIGPTIQIYAPLIQKNAPLIRSVPKATHSYGPQERQKLDIYTPPNPSIINGRKAILVFVHGGGFVQGSKTLEGIADNLVHSNVAAFFALKYGYTVVIPDYRLVFKHSDAVFPSGGEDVALVVEWIMSKFSGSEEPSDLFIMGNSAGGTNLMTFLLHPTFASTRAKVLSNESKTQLRGIIPLSAPFHFKTMEPYREEVITTYYGSPSAHIDLSPLGLFKAARKNGSLDFLASGVRALLLNAELDPEDEINQSRDELVREWMEIGTPESRNSLAVDMMKGHNHISPVFGLMTGIEREEAWGVQVATFCENLRKF